MHNENVSKVLTKHGFNVPKTQVIKINSEFCEVYPFIEGTTLFERSLNHDISPEKIRKIYKQMIDILYELRTIPCYEINEEYDKCQPLLHRIVHEYFKDINQSKNTVCHYDLTDKNILLDNQNNICGILDLDSVIKGSFELSLIRLAVESFHQGLDLKDIYILCSLRFDHNFRYLENYVKKYVFYRNIYWLFCGKYFKNIQTLQNTQK